MNAHPVDNLLCLARALAGNLHANYHAPIHFEMEHCKECKSLEFCRMVELLVKGEISVRNNQEAVQHD